MVPGVQCVLVARAHPQHASLCENRDVVGLRSPWPRRVCGILPRKAAEAGQMSGGVESSGKMRVRKAAETPPPLEVGKLRGPCGQHPSPLEGLTGEPLGERVPRMRSCGFSRPQFPQV